MQLASTPTIVDLRTTSRAKEEKAFAWTPKEAKPERQLAAKREAMRFLGARLERLKLAMGELPRVQKIGRAHV